MRNLVEIQVENSYPSRLLNILTQSSETGVGLRFKNGDVPIHKGTNAMNQNSLTKGSSGDENGGTETGSPIFRGTGVAGELTSKRG